MRKKSETRDSARAKLSRTEQRLAESLEQQAATNAILAVIAESPGELQPVFDKIAKNAVRLCAGEFSAVYRYDGEAVSMVAHHGMTQEQVEYWNRAFPRPPGEDTTIGRAILSRTVATIPDVDTDAAYAPVATEVARFINYKSVIAVPMMHQDQPIGGILVARRKKGLFPENQVELLKTFADQAVITIKSVRLFRKVSRQLDIIRDVFGKYVPENVAEAIVAGEGVLKPAAVACSHHRRAGHQTRYSR